VPQDDCVTVWQVPVPLQVRAGVKVAPAQLAATQTVPLAYNRHAPPPSHAPSVPQVDAPLSAHWPSGSAPAGTSVHVPVVPASPHDRQAPVHAVRQQVPCSQKPLAHSAAVVHEAPLVRLPQLPALQTFGATQSVSAPQVIRQAPVAPHLYAPQFVAVEVPHVPAPSQVRAGVNVVPLQVDAAQVVPIAYWRQAPPPSQVPSVPQVPAPWSVHWLNGSSPAATDAQVPTVPVKPHDRQIPMQAVAQQTPCSQKPELHSPAAPHVAPIGFLPQLPEMQVFGLVQSALVVQVVRHAAVALQTYGSQVDSDVVWQVPVPLHVRAGENVDPVQLAVWHTVPAAYSRQPPAPSQVPSVPHVVAPLSMHWFSGSAPTGTNVHVPELPDSAHDRQVPVQLELQQTPCWQRPDAHSVPPVHVTPSGFFVHWPALQMLGATQSASTEHVVRQLVPPALQLKAPHESGAAA
jgi:hypothetical protein